MDGIRVAARAVIRAVTGVAGPKHKEERLRTGDLRESITDGGIVASRRQIVGVVVRIVPTVVGDESIGTSGSLLEVGVGGRPGIGIGGDGEDLRGRGQATELVAHGGHY